MKRLIYFFLLLPTLVFSQKDDEYLNGLYDRLHDSPMQQKLRYIAPVPFGVVFLPWAGCTEQDMRHHFRMMKQLGFTNLKQTMATPEWPEKEIMRIALEEGIIPFWYGEGGWEPITPELLDKLAIPRNTSVEEIVKNPKMQEYQMKVLLNQLEDWKKPSGRQVQNYVHYPDAYLRPDDVNLFRAWVKSRYKTIEELTKAWNQYEVGITAKPYKTWDDFDEDPLVSVIPEGEEIIPREGREYGRVRDILRFKADMYIENIRNNVVSIHSEQPVRAGGEMGMFLPFASRGVDMEGIAEVMKERGSFYPSIHLAWHFEEAEYEVARCVYMQASLAVDWFKGGWAATWESTGGPQQFSGGKGWERKGKESTAGFTVNAGTITQLLLSYLAAGFKGAGLWAWNYRRAGWESGEYALLNRQNEPCERTIRAGEIAKAADKYRFELWQAHKEPFIGVFVNWDNEAIWAACAGPNRTHFKNYPVQARIGISRALINANLPWEYVTPSDLKSGLAPRYKVIYLPAQVAINEELFPIFEAYVKQGGRLIADAPTAWWDEHGKVLNTGRGSAFEKIFGASIRDFQYSGNVPRRLKNHYFTGFLMELAPTTATVRERFQTGEPAVTINRLDKGFAVILSPDVSFSLKSPGNDFAEKWVIHYIMEDLPAPFMCKNAIVYRLASPKADHYFIINDDEPKTTFLSFRNFRYKNFTDALTGEKVNPRRITLEGFSGRWIRCEK